MITGGCQCGAVRYAVDAEALDVYCCHCRDCQKQSASAFGISVIFPETAVRVTEGAPRVWRRTLDSGIAKECSFCPACGTRLFHASGGDGTLSVKGGSLDQAPDLTAAKHVWLKRKLAGVTLPEGVECWQEEPE